MGIKASASVTVAQVTDGTDGNGIKSTVVEYQAGASGTTAPTGSWSTSIPATTASAPYLWTKVTYTYTDGSAPKVVYSVGSTPEGIVVGGRNLAQRTSSSFTNAFTSFTGGQNICPSLAKVLTDGLSVGDIITIKLIYKYTDVVATSGQTAICYIQGAGNVTDWSAGKFELSPRKTLSGSGEHEFLYSFTITADHLKNSFWDTNIRHDYVQSGSVQWKMYKVEKGNKATDWTPAPEDVDASIAAVNKKVNNAQLEIDTANGKITTLTSETSSLGTRMSTVEQSAEKIDFLITTETGTTNFTLTDAGATLLSENLTITDGNGSTVITGGKLTIGFRDNLVKDVTEGSLTVLDDKLEVLTFDTVSITVNGEELYANNIISLIFANSSGGDGWVYYFNKRVTIPRFEVNLSLAAFGDITGFIVHRTESLNYVVWYENDTWYGQLADGTGGSSEWSWNSATDIVLAEWTKKTAESIAYQVYSPARSYEEIRTKAMLGNWASGAISENTMIDGGLLKTHTVVAEKLATDAIKSSNYVYSSGKFSNSGTFLDLSLGTVKSKNFSIDENGSVGVIGDITANSLNVKQYITITNPTTGQSGKVISYEGSGSNQLSLGGTQASRIASLVSIWGPVSIGGDGNNSVLSCAKVNTEQISNVYTINSGEGTIGINGSIEIYESTPYIDFHASGSTADFTSRIIADPDGGLNFYTQNGGHTYKLLNGFLWTYGDGGWYSSHGGGWYMIDDVWVRTFGEKPIYTGAGSIYTSGGNFLAHTDHGLYCQSTGHWTIRTFNSSAGMVSVGVGNGSEPLRLFTNDKVWKGNSTTTYFSTASSSDKRLKKDFNEITDAYEKMYMDTDVYSFRYILEDDIIHYGFMAQDVIENMKRYGIPLDNNLYGKSKSECFERDITGDDYTYNINYLEWIPLNKHMITKTINRLDKFEESSQQQIDRLREELSQTRIDYVELLTEVKRLKEKLESVA